MKDIDTLMKFLLFLNMLYVIVCICLAYNYYRLNKLCIDTNFYEYMYKEYLLRAIRWAILLIYGCIMFN